MKSKTASLAYAQNEDSAHFNSLLPHERLALTRESRVRDLFEKRSSEWARFRDESSKKLQRPPSQSVVASADEFRAKQEDLTVVELAQHQVQERHSAEDWRASLRAGKNTPGVTFVLVGNAFTGIWGAVKERRPEDASIETVRGRPPRHISVVGEKRRSRSSETATVDFADEGGDTVARSFSVAGERTKRNNNNEDTEDADVDIEIQTELGKPRGSFAWREQESLKKSMRHYAPQIKAVRSHDLAVDESSNLIVTGESLLEWASRSAGIDPRLLRGRNNEITTNLGPHSTEILQGSNPGGDFPADVTGNNQASQRIDLTARTASGIPSHGTNAGGNHYSIERHGMTFGELRDEDIPKPFDHMNEAIALHQGDLVRASLIAGNVWQSINKMLHQQPGLAGLTDLNSLGSGSFRDGSVTTPTGSVVAARKVHLLRLGTDPLQGPHAHIQVVSDNVTTKEDIGASVGTTGRLPPFRRLLSAYDYDASAAAVFIASSGGFEDDQGNSFDSHINTRDSTFEDWDQSLVVGRKNVETYRHQPILESKRSESKDSIPHLFSSTGATTAFLQATTTTSRSMNAARGWPEVALESSVGSQAVARIRFANTGTTVLYYKWVAIGGNGKPRNGLQDTINNSRHHNDSLSSQHISSNPVDSMMHLDATLPLLKSAERFSASVVLGDSSSSIVVLPNAVSASRGPRFICAKLSGSITPGSVTDFLFTFEAISPGVFTESWQLQTTPPCNDATPIVITLRGVATRADESAPKRVRLDKKLHSAVSFSMCREIMNELIESLDLEAPPEPPHDVRVEIERKAFTRLNPDLFYHEDVYSALNKQVAQPAFEVLNVHPRKRIWNGCISDLHNLVSKVLPGPETESEKLIREELERREAFEAQRIEDERIAAEAAAVAAAAAQAAADAAASDPKNKKKGTTKDISRPMTPAVAEEPKVNEPLQAVHIPEPVKIVTETPSMRRERLTNLYHSLMSILGTLTVAASKRPLEDSPLFNPIRSLLFGLIDLIPFAAGGAKEAEKQDLCIEPATSDVSLRSWPDLIPHDEHQQELLKYVYGKNGRPPPRVRAMRPKLGRDGEYHLVPVDPNDGFDDPPDEEEEEEEAENEHGEETDEEFNSNFLMRETFKQFSRRIASETFSAKDSVRELSRHEEMRKAQEAAEAAAREKALIEQAAQAKGKPVVKGLVTPIILSTIPDVQAPPSPQPQSSLGLDLHPLASIIPKLPENAWSLGEQQVSGIEEEGGMSNQIVSSGQNIKYLMRFSFVVRKLVYQCLSKVGAASLDIEAQTCFENRDRIKMNLTKKLSLHDVIVDGKIVFVRSGYDMIPHKVLRRAAFDIQVGGTSYLDVLSRNSSFLSSIPTIASAVEKNARLIIVSSAQGSSPLPYPDNVSTHRGVMTTTWPPPVSSKGDSSESPEDSIGLLGGCEGFTNVLANSQVLPISRDVVLELEMPNDSEQTKSMAEIEGEEELKILAQCDIVSNSEKQKIFKPILRVFMASSLIGIALSLSNVIPSRASNGTYVIFTLLTSFENVKVFFQGREISKHRDKNDMESKIDQNHDAFLNAMDECINSSSDFSDFSRNLSNRHEIPYGTLIVLENLLHPSSYASEVGSKRVFGLTRLLTDIPFGQVRNETLVSSNNSTTVGNNILNSSKVSNWKAHQVSLWLSHLCMGIQHEFEWNKYVSSFARAGVDGGVLIAWLSAALNAHSPMDVPSLGPHFVQSLKSLGVEDIMHQQLIESAILALIPRIESEDLAMSRIKCIDLWASKQADMASAAMRTAANEIGATMRIQSLLRGHIARRRAAQAKSRETQKAPASSNKSTLKRSEMVNDKKKRLKHSGADQIKLLASPAGTLVKDSSADVGNDFITKSKGPDSQSVRFAAFSTELTSFAFLSKAARGQAAFRAVLSSCCDVFVQDSLLASLDETASTCGVRPHRTAANLLRLKDAQSNHKVGAGDMRKKKKKKNASEKPKRNVIQMSQEENAAVSIQRIAKGRKARRDVLELKATMSKDKEHHTKLRRTTSSPAIFDIIQRPGDGCRVAGLHLYNEISIMGKIIQPIPSSLHLPGHEISNDGPILSILGGGGNLFQKVASLETLINCSDAVFLGGLIGFAWLAHTSPAFWSGPSSKKALSLANTAFGVTSSVCSGFYNIGVELRRLARFAEKKKVTIIAPIDAIAGVKNLKSPIFDVRIFNPKLTTAESQAISSTSSDDVGVISDESSVLVSSHTKLLCDAPEETHEEDQVPDEDYDSDNSEDMVALKERNTRIKIRDDAFASLRKARMDDLLRRAKTRPEHVLELSTSSVLGPSLTSTSGLTVPIPGPFHSLSKPLFMNPDSEASNFEFDTENAQFSTRTVDLLALSVSGSNNVVDSSSFFQADEVPFDIGPSTMEVLLEAVQGAKQVLVYGPLGVVEILDGAASTLELLSALDARDIESLKSVLIGGSLLAFANRVKKGISSASLLSRNGGLLLSTKLLPGISMLSERE